MHFSTLRLVGFKSFVEATDFTIEPGLTGLVGPNGCGKSNLVEALRWVMGENSYRSMRASGMDDVIFAGGGDRPARNMAEVGLVLDNAARTAPAAFNDADVLEITRRIEREQGSTYRINGREVRARDVQILFADAATGARSPALVRQGQISEIINAKPQARRRILEDAAGIAGLHTRRQEAELRLRGAEDNLSRIDDVISQIAYQSESLRRQARQASRYRELQGEIRRAQALAMLIDYEDARRELDDARTRLAATSARVVDCTRAQAEAARHQAVAAHALPALRESEIAAGGLLQRNVLARETLDGEERRAKGRLAEIDDRIKEMKADITRDAAVLADAAGVLARLDAEEAELKAGSSTQELEATLNATLRNIESARAQAEARLTEAQTDRADADATRRALEGRRRDEAARLVRSEGDLAKARAAREGLSASLDLTRDLEASAEALRLATVSRSIAEAAASAAERELAAAREADQASRTPLVEADRMAQRLETEAKTLGKLLETGAGAKWPPITDAMRVTKGYELALGAALGDDLDASSDIRAPAHWAKLDAENDAPLPVGAEPLSHVVTGPPALTRRLAQIGFVATADGPALQKSLAPGQRLVSGVGDIWRWDGFTQAAGAPTPAAQRLAERNRLAEVRSEAAAARQAYEALKHIADDAQATLREALARDGAARGELQATRRASDGARDGHAALERRQGESRSRLVALDTIEAGALAANDEAKTRHATTEQAIAALAPIDDLLVLIPSLQEEVARHRSTETATRSSLQSIARERDARVRRLAAIAAEFQSWRTRREQAEGHRVEVEARLETALGEQEALVGAPDNFILAKRRLLGDIETAEAALRAASDKRVKAETILAEADRAGRGAVEAMTAAREDRARAEARDEAARQRLDGVVRASATELECATEALPAMAGLQAGEARPSMARVAERLEQLKQDRERLGAVNLRAEDELASMEDQRSTLDKEKADLGEAIRRLRQAIGSLNKEGRERLLGAFEIVNSHFRDLFTNLFGGGTAELQLIESDDPLEAGLEILARPPGKKPQVMTLLSGGEQALTAMSLIFAVFLTNPSPICVLDEVDAPLDDANVERFCDLIDAMRRKTDTRFITITHNPITMARMDRLFGVTMAEHGVSQLVSVDLAGAENLLEAAG